MTSFEGVNDQEGMPKREPTTQGQELFEKLEEDEGIQSDDSAGEGLVSEEENQAAEQL